MSEKVRKLALSEHKRTRALYEAVFPDDSARFVDYYYQEKVIDNSIYVIEDGERIVSMSHLKPYAAIIGGTSCTIHYIVAVATAKEYRHRGYMRMLLEKVMKDLRAEGELITYLMPVAEAIYSPYEFYTVYRKKWEYLTLDQVQKEGYEELAGKDIPALVNQANAFFEDQYQVYTLRSERYYQRLIKEYGSDGGQLFVKKDGNKIVKGGVLLSGEGFKETVIMIRILDVKRLLSLLSLKSLVALCFEVVDKDIEENNLCLTITGTEHSGCLLMDSPVENREGIIPIGVLCGFVFGTLSIEELAEQEGVQLSERLKEELKKIIPLKGIMLDEVV